MIVDDEADMRMALRLFLERGGHTVEEAENGEMALEKLPAGNFDLVLMDMRMPGMDGVQTLGKIRESNATLPVIMVTGYGSVDNTAEVLALGATALVSKPFQHQELREAMSKAGMADAISAEERGIAGERRQKQRKIMAGVAVAAVIGCLISYNLGWWTNRNFKLAYTNPVDMSWNNGQLWVADWFTQSIYIHDVNKSGAPIVKTYYLPEVHVTGIAVAGDRLYTADAWDKKLRRHKLDEYLTAEKVLNSPGGTPTSLFFDGKYLWSIDSKQGKIYQHRMDDNLTVLADFKTPASAPVGFFKDDQFAWTSDSQTRLLYKHRLDDQLSVVAAYSVDELEARREPLACFRWIEGNIWFARDRLNVLYKRTPRSLKSAKSK